DRYHCVTYSPFTENAENRGRDHAAVLSGRWPRDSATLVSISVCPGGMATKSPQQRSCICLGAENIPHPPSPAWGSQTPRLNSVSRNFSRASRSRLLEVGSEVSIASATSESD